MLYIVLMFVLILFKCFYVFNVVKLPFFYNILCIIRHPFASVLCYRNATLLYSVIVRLDLKLAVLHLLFYEAQTTLW